jgi:O-succinylbenzoic acid--CoA ligase
MTPTFDKIHARFKLNNIHYDFEELKEVAYSLIKEGAPFEKNMGDFLLDWLNHDNYIKVKTSGSTGLPKLMKVNKQAMVNSAIATGDYFKMEPGDSALLCLPTHYIAGKMMLVRAMILGLELDFVEPNSHPVFDYGKPYDFCAMIPLQVQNQLNYLNNIKTLIVGGASISKTLESKIQDLNTHVFATYGMTETVTHIAVKALNGKQKMKHFNVFPKVKISTDKRNCLVIEAPYLSKEKVFTNDIVTLVSDSEFDIVGRIDNMINSGSVKLFPERIEAKLELKIKERFFIASEKDEKLGQKLILLLESKTNTIKPSVFKELDKFEIPKTIYTIPKFVYTVTGKIQRQETLKLLK